MKKDRGKLALLVSDSLKAQAGSEALRDAHDWVPFAEADTCVVLGGDGYLLHVLHSMIDNNTVKPCYGINLGTVGFMLNRNSGSRPIGERVERAQEVEVSPLAMDAVTRDGQHHRHFEQCAAGRGSVELDHAPRIFFSPASTSSRTSSRWSA